MIKPQLAFDPSMAHEILEGEDRRTYLSRLLAVVPDSGWVMEPKLDGWRWQSLVKETEPDHPNWVQSIGGRNGKEHSTPSHIEEQLRKLPAGTILDGELVGPEGGFDPGTTANRGKQKLVLFDVLAFDGLDCTAHPWRGRRRLLEGLTVAFGVAGPVSVVPTAEVDVDVLERWLDAGVEGAVCKRIDAPYRPGSRRRDGFVKIKPKQTTDAIVFGWKYGEGASNQHRCGALEVRLVETGALTTVGYDGTPEKANGMVGRRIEVQHFGWISKTGKVRHPGYVRLRPDLEEVA